MPQSLGIKQRMLPPASFTSGCSLQGQAFRRLSVLSPLNDILSPYPHNRRRYLPSHPSLIVEEQVVWHGQQPKGIFYLNSCRLVACRADQCPVLLGIPNIQKMKICCTTCTSAASSGCKMLLLSHTNTPQSHPKPLLATLRV